jgi:hypothetical protein
MAHPQFKRLKKILGQPRQSSDAISNTSQPLTQPVVFDYKANLIIPVYLDQTTLFGMWATFAGGFSMVEGISMRTAAKDTREASLQAEAGVNIPGLVKLGMSGAKGVQSTQEGEILRSLELYQTPESLFHALRKELIYSKALKTPTTVAEWAQVGYSDFVELSGIFRQNPVLENFSTTSSLLRVILPFLKTQQKKAGDFDPAMINQVLDKIVSEISGNTRLFVVDLTQPPDYRAIVSLFAGYSRDPTMEEISNREFRLLGKVVGKMDYGSVDLLRNTKLGVYGSALRPILASLGDVPKSMGISAQDKQLATTIEAPILEVVPVAIYV